MIYISNRKRIPLPRKFRPINNTSAYIYDQLVELLNLELYESLKRTSVIFKQEAEGIGLDSRTINVLEWLKSNGRHSEFKEVLIKKIGLAIVGDMANFIYESISAAQRGKLSVAYALLRKPFTDELLILEQLLVDADTFIDKFYNNKDPAKYDPIKLSGGSDGLKTLIKNCVNRINSKLYNPGLLYEFRYDGSSAAGILGYSHKALHIVTKGKGYETSIQNLNFVFSDKSDFDSQWKHYFFVMPYLLIYSAEVIDALFSPFLAKSEQLQTLKIRSVKRFFAIIQWLHQSNWNKQRERAAISEEIKNTLKFKCDSCQYVNKFEDADIDLYFEIEILLCKNCFQAHSLI